jgi:hypothetical protein
MSLRTFLKRNYDLVRESEALGASVLIHAAIAIALLFVVVSSSESLRDAVKTFFKKQEQRVVEPPKPVVLPKDIPINLPPPPPKLDNLQKLTERMTIKKPPKDALRPKMLSSKRKRKVDFKTAKDLGQNVRGMMNLDYANRFGVESRGKGIRAIIEQFVVVQYEGGDWDCEFHHNGGEVYFNRGSIPNLILEIERRTNIEVNNKDPKVVRADSPEIHKSPFVYFTGHKNFTLTEAEVENLRTYLLQGGAIVANSSLPGRRSRFDVAFRREMARVIPDHELTAVNNKHPLYSSFVNFQEVPEGMNYWQEPLEVIDIDGRIVVIYNLNDYGDMMLATLDSTGNAIKRGLSDDTPGYRWQGPHIWHLEQTGTLYANVSDFQTVLNSYMMNINILAHLLTR